MNASRRSGLVALVLPLLLLVSTLSLTAQGRPTDRPGNQPADRGPEQPVKVVAHFLELSDVQVEQWVKILQELHQTLHPLAQSLAEKEKALATLIESDSPDPGAIGSLVLEIRGLRQHIHMLQRKATTDFEALLDEEQTDRLTHIRQVAPVARLLPAFQALYLL